MPEEREQQRHEDEEEAADFSNTTAQEEEEIEGFKIHISRVPTKFTEDIVQRILNDEFGADAVLKVELILPRLSEEEEEEQQQQHGLEESNNNTTFSKDEEEVMTTHRGFGFVTFRTEEAQTKAIKMETIKGGRTPNSTKVRTMYLRPYAAETDDDDRNVCYLWKQHRCPYGDDCKFTHSGPGSCKVPIAADVDEETAKLAAKKKKGKCFLHKKGKCTKGDDCPFSHDFVVDKSQDGKLGDVKKEIPKSEKDCINWKTKGKCRKKDRCPYRHDEEVQKAALKKQNKKKKTATNQDKKEKQPLSVRVFGLNYESTEQDVRDFFSECGPIQDVTFPIFEDSGRSKGYCGVWFSSPKAVAKAVALDGEELMGRWLRIQAGKMYLKQWEDMQSLSSLQKDQPPPSKRARTF
eukprot:scaffold3236_cov66-Cylindrotheca_fusiformis.AAC.27